MQRSWICLPLVWIASLASAEAPECPLPIGAAVAAGDAAKVAREADRRLRWSLQTVEVLRDELRQGEFSHSPRSARDRKDLVRSVIRTGAWLWLDLKRAACECDSGAHEAAACATLEADAERLRLAMPRISIRRPPDVDRLTKGR